MNSFAFDKKTKQKVAIKKLKRPFDDEIHARLTYRELHILKHVNHENLIKLIDTFTTAATAEEMQNVYVIKFYRYFMGYT